MANLTLPLEGKKADLLCHLINNQRTEIEIEDFCFPETCVINDTDWVIRKLWRHAILRLAQNMPASFVLQTSMLRYRESFM